MRRQIYSYHPAHSTQIAPQAPDAEAAVALTSKIGNSLDLLLTDVVLPGRTG